VGVGDRHSCAVVDEAGTPAVRCWGANASGQLGDGSKNPSPIPVAVTSLP
jgi:alpha-tubulin suppressor-like RCC1 family protein